MSSTHLLDVLLSPQLLLASLAYGTLIVMLEIVTVRLQQQVHDVPITAWIVERMLLPWSRVVVLLVFIVLAYPRLFGLADGPAITTLLWSQDGRVSTLVNTAVVLSLLLPAVPLLGKLKGLVLPLQAIAMAALVFHWLALAQGIPAVSFWPGWQVAVAIILLAPLTQWGAVQAAHGLGERLNRRYNRTGFETVCYEGLLLMFQIPAVLLYTLTLGQQLRAL